MCRTRYTERTTSNWRVISDAHQKTYCVRERMLGQAADLLAGVADKLTDPSTHADGLPERRDGAQVSSTEQGRPTTVPAYENKGEKLALCLNEKKEDADSRLIDENTLMYVAMHELAHVGTMSVGHGDEFWANFKTIIERAVDRGLYRPVDYKKNNKLYCGMNLTDNPYFDG